MSADISIREVVSAALADVMTAEREGFRVIVREELERARQVDRYLSYEEAGKLTGQSADAFRVWLRRPAQADLLRQVVLIGDRPRIRQSALCSFLERGRK